MLTEVESAAMRAGVPHAHLPHFSAGDGPTSYTRQSATAATALDTPDASDELHLKRRRVLPELATFCTDYNIVMQWPNNNKSGFTKVHRDV